MTVRRPAADAGGALDPVGGADQVGQPAQEGGVVDAAAVDAGVRAGPQLLHALVAPRLRALGPGLQDREQDDAAGAEVGVVGVEVADAADVRGLVEDTRRTAPAAGRPATRAAWSSRASSTAMVSAATSGPTEPDAFLAQRVQRVGRAGERDRVERRGGVGPVAGGDPAGDVAVAQPGQQGPGGAVDALALLVGQLGQGPQRVGAAGRSPRCGGRRRVRCVRRRCSQV